MFSGLLSHSAAPAADFSRLQRASITFRDVAKRYGDHQVLNAINLQVEPGEVVAILGPSGSGKSTLIRLINQLESLSGGEILIDGKPTSRLSGSALRQLRSRVGFVFQQFNLYAHLTAQENITLALERVHGWEKSAAQARALALLRQVGLEEKAQQMPAQLSGGQQQRVAIARALASSPQIILFDEPTSALDPEMIGEVLQVMKTLAHSGITMLVVTHEMQFAREIADRVVFIDGGDILEVAPPAEFFAHPQHARARRFLQKVLDPLHQGEPRVTPMLDWHGVLSGQPLQWIISGFLTTIWVSVAGILLATLLAVLLLALRLGGGRAGRGLVAAWVSLFRNTPLLVQLLFWYFAAWNLLPLAVKEVVNDEHAWSILPGNVWWLTPEFLCSMWGLGVFTSAFLVEEIASGLRAVSHGQREAALSQGFTPWQELRFILLPQGLGNAWQPIVGQYLNLMKLSSLASGIGFAELTYQVRQIESYNAHALEAFAVGTALYLALGVAMGVALTRLGPGRKTATERPT